MSDRPNPAQLLRSLLPHVVAVAILAGLAGSFYSKSFDGYRLKMPDIEHYIATTKEVKDHRDRTGEQALWTDSQFGGMPTFQLGMQTTDVNAGSWLGRAMRLGFPRPADHLPCVLAITAPWSARVHAVARETHGRVCPLCYLLPVNMGATMSGSQSEIGR